MCFGSNHYARDCNISTGSAISTSDKIILYIDLCIQRYTEVYVLYNIDVLILLLIVIPKVINIQRDSTYIDMQLHE